MQIGTYLPGIFLGLLSLTSALPGLAFQAGIHQHARQDSGALSVEKIMRDPKWMGTSPSKIQWSYDSRKLYFYWNPEGKEGDSLYAVRIGAAGDRSVAADIAGERSAPEKVEPAERLALPGEGRYSLDRSHMVYEKKGDIFVLEVAAGKNIRLSNSGAKESDPRFTSDGSAVLYISGNNLYRHQLGSGAVEQLSDFVAGDKPDEKKPSGQDAWLKGEQQQLFPILARRERQDSLREAQEKREDALSRPERIYIGAGNMVSEILLSPDERFITYQVIKPPAGNKDTKVPDYVTLSGYTEEIISRTKVGSMLPRYEFYIYDRKRDTIYQPDLEQIPGIYDLPEFLAHYPEKQKALKEKKTARPVVFHGPFWSPEGGRAVVVVRSQDNKDRWIMQLEPGEAKLRLLDRQHDSAWVSGPGIEGWHSPGKIDWIDKEHIYFHSEESGYSHLYSLNVRTGRKKALTSGRFEIQESLLSHDRQWLYFTSNEVHPGEKHFYRMPSQGGERVQLTRRKGAHQAWLSPDEKYIAFLYSASNKPWELYVQENHMDTPMPEARQLTHSVTEEFLAYPWREPELISFPNREGKQVYARLYRPEKPNGAGVIFVHGAGYLQNAHFWWSNYFREYMFHNLLADEGFTVLDIDYQGSAGYGRDWRTAIYRHMGGGDLNDHVDGARLLVSRYGIDPERIGLYGGSYGGFITLMALFREPEVFAAGAALRSVTDWSHYNHGYTSNILNTPELDPDAFRRSSPIYFAEGLEDPLLMCHGMVDVNVHFQDIVRLSQRLIELGKDDWELAVYPLEDHAFTEASSWTDEYKRIHRLFREVLLSEKAAPRQVTD